MGINELADSYRAQLKTRVSHAVQSIEHTHAQLVNNLLPAFSRLYREIDTLQKEVKSDEPDRIPLVTIPASKLESIKREVMSHVSNFAEFAKLTTKQLIHFAASLGTKAADALLALVLPFDGFAALPVPDLVNTHRDRLEALFDGWWFLVAQSAIAASQRGAALGHITSQIAQEVTQALDEPRWRAQTIADTETFRAFNQVARDNYAQAPGITGWTWHCQLTSHSCAACIAMHGSKYGPDETLHDHPNGSCVAIPYVDGMQIQTGPEWFTTQDEAIQRSILGTKIAYDLYKSGASLHTFIGKSHDARHGTSVYQRSAKEMMR